MKISEYEMEHGGFSRAYRLLLPEDYDPARPWPLLVALHGGGGTAEKFLRGSHLDAVARRRGFLLALPEAVAWRWNDGRELEEGEPEVDDVAFFRALVAAIGQSHNVDGQRVYAAGMSNGGYMCMRLACEAADVIAAAGVVAAAMLESQAQTHPQPPAVPIAFLKGTEDLAVPWEGGENISQRGAILSMDDTIEYWRKANGSPEDLRHTQFEQPEDDPTTVTKHAWSSADGGERVVLYEIEGGGHNWPGGELIDETGPRQAIVRSMLRRMYGKCSKAIDAGEELWEFFSQHSLG